MKYNKREGQVAMKNIQLARQPKMASTIFSIACQSQTEFHHLQMYCEKVSRLIPSLGRVFSKTFHNCEMEAAIGEVSDLMH